MRSIQAVLDDLEDVLEELAAADLDAVAPAARYTVLERLETAARRQTAVSHTLVAGLEQLPGWPAPHIALSDVLRISRAEARRRVRDAALLTPRRSLTGEPLPPLLEGTAEAWQAGVLDGEHLAVIQRFLRELPAAIGPMETAKAERTLATQAATLRPDQLQTVAARMALTLNPDGKFSDQDRALQRGFTWSGAQRPDGMSTGKLVATPELRAELDAWFAKFAAPGMCNPDDQTPVVNGEPSEEAAQQDLRSHGQRQHDALGALVRSQLGNPELGAHRGLPVTVIATVTLSDLQHATGHAVTAGGTLLPMRDLIRMAAHANHYLAVFDQHTDCPLYLGRAKRIASADQRIVLHAKDRGCTAPGCTAPGYLCEVHHVEEWAAGGRTDIDTLTFACAGHHKLLDHGWTTKKLANGDTQWIPPPQLPLPAGTNTYHHPERLLVSPE
ncbi:MAG: HNH endonuclease [Mycobacterium sp.]|nr:HNH endonuclease [Mycobacterium sp.]